MQGLYIRALTNIRWINYYISFYVEAITYQCPHLNAGLVHCILKEDACVHSSSLRKYQSETASVGGLSEICLDSKHCVTFHPAGRLVTWWERERWERLQYGILRNLFETQSSRNLVCPLQWRRNGRHGVSNHRRLDCLLNRLFRRGSKKTTKLRVTGLCKGNSPVTGEFPAQRTSNAETISIWWRHNSITPSQFPKHIFRFAKCQNE